ncbi:MAG: HipA domain-containing protein [Rhodobacteraceae bacterium]|nr:HipA domain-containing protein [Paracoccaceae bacterium]
MCRKRCGLNILVGNADDHARNHAAFWDGDVLALTPAYDIAPQVRAAHEANQAWLSQMEIAAHALKPA